MLLQRRNIVSGCSSGTLQTASAWHSHCATSYSVRRGQQCTSTLRRHEPFCTLPSAHRSRHRHSTVAAANKQLGSTPTSDTAGLSKVVLRGIAAAIASAVLLTAPLGPTQLVQPAAAADAAKVGGCLLRKCQLQLAQCLGDAQCLQNIVCLNLCNSADDETGCQIRCGDLYGDAAVDTFNACAVSDQKCVPQRVDEGLYPVPPDCALDTAFNMDMFKGRWYITAGYNPLFDIFDCQEHFFGLMTPEGQSQESLVAKINWRIGQPNGDFIERSTIQMFVPEKGQPAHLLNHGNEYLHYEDDWYILASKPDSYIVVYYKGNNDAWRGYGGAVVYTKEAKFPQEFVPEVSAAVEQVGLKWSDFKLTDNSCGPHPPRKSLVQQVEEEVVREVEQVEKEVEREGAELGGGLRSFGRGFTVLEEEVEAELAAGSKVLQRDLMAAEELLAQVEREVEAEEALVADELDDASVVLGRFVESLTGLFRSAK